MSQNLSPQSPMQPLSVGNVVSAGFRLYSSHFKLYFGIALRATLWVLLPFVALIPLPLLFFASAQPNYSLLPLSIPLWLLLLLYCSAKYIVNSALISRLAFGELVNQPESIKMARSYVNPRIWQFLLMSILVGLIFFAISIGLSIVGFILGLGSAGILGALLGGSVQTNSVAALIFGLIIIVIILALLCVLIVFLVRLGFIVEVPLAIEQNIDATGTIGRSWELAKGNVLRLILIATIAFLITIPVYLVTQIIALAIQPILANFFPQQSPSFVILTNILAYIIGLLGNMIILPLWQAIEAVIYYDLRSRREGLGLRLRDRTI